MTLHSDTSPRHRHGCRCGTCNTPMPRYSRSNQCARCDGSGEIVAHRMRWIGGGRTGYRDERFDRVRCQECNGKGRAA